MPPPENEKLAGSAGLGDDRRPPGGLRPAVFLDRDGTINRECEYLHRIEDFDFIPGAPDAVRRLRAAGYLVVAVTNQSGIARGLYRREEVEGLHRHIQAELSRRGTALDGFYFCPHHPEGTVSDMRVECKCRKGLPGMLFRAAADFGIDLGASFMVGDKASDVEAGLGAGCRPILVLTGWGGRETRSVDLDVPRAASIVEAADFILEKS